MFLFWKAEEVYKKILKRIVWWKINTRFVLLDFGNKNFNTSLCSISHDQIDFSNFKNSIQSRRSQNILIANV